VTVEPAESDRLDNEDRKGRRKDRSHPSLPESDPVVAVDRQNNDGNREEPDPCWDADRTDHEVHCLRLDNEVSCQESEVERNRRGEERDRSIEPKLSPTLNHLRNTQPRPLKRMEPHHAEADDDADDDRDRRPEKVESEQDRDATEHHRKDHRVQPKPERELIANGAVTLFGRHVIDRADLDLGQAFRVVRGVCHRLGSAFSPSIDRRKEWRAPNVACRRGGRSRPALCSGAGPDQPLPSSAELPAIVAGVDWLLTSRPGITAASQFTLVASARRAKARSMLAFGWLFPCARHV
jgi:hypothetical protein